VSLQDAGSGPRDDLTKIGTNNRLRKLLRTTIARFDLSSPNPAVKLAAIQEMLRDSIRRASRLCASGLASKLTRRSRKRSRRGLRSPRSMARSPGPLEAVARSPQAQAAGAEPARGVLENAADGTFVEPDEKVRQAAAAAVRGIDRSRALYAGVESCSLSERWIGARPGRHRLAITFGVMGVINMAHGELMMLGAYTTYVVQLALPNHIGASILLAIPAAFPRCRFSRG